MSRGHVGVERAPRRRRRRERYDELAAWADARGYDDRHLLARVRGADAQVTSWSSSMRTDNLREGTRNVASMVSGSFNEPFAATIRATVVFARRDFSS